MNSKKKGDIGLGAAIAYFTLVGMTVCVPLTDSQDYDLVIERDGNLEKVQVKYSASKKPNGIYSVELRIKGGNSKTNFVSKMATDLDYDSLFILTLENDRYFIPRDFIKGNTNSIALGRKFDQFKID